MRKHLVFFLGITSFGCFGAQNPDNSSGNLTGGDREIINGIMIIWNGPTQHQKEVISELLDNMIYVEGGSFMMGSADQEDNEHAKPVHRANVGSFRIDKYELTKKVWDAITGNDYVLNYCAVKNLFDKDCYEVKNDNYPVIVYSADWEDLNNFFDKLNSLTGLNFRLPTEAEWEYAAKGGRYSRGYKFSGSNSLDAVAWHHDNGRKIHAVGEKSPNELGIYDMSGNVLEWTSDLYSESYDTLPEPDEYLNVSRGGYFERSQCKVTERYYGDADGGYVGVRLVLD